MADQVLEGSQPVDLRKHPSGIVPTLQNIVSTVNLDCKLDLKAIALQARNAEYNPKRFAAVIMRIREPKTTALIFASGKMVCAGAVSEKQLKLAARKYARIVRKLGFPVEFKDFKIQSRNHPSSRHASSSKQRKGRETKIGEGSTSNTASLVNMTRNLSLNS